MLDPTGIFDLPNTSLIFWEVVVFLVLLGLLYWFVWPPIRDTIRQRQQSIEQAIDEAENTRREARELLEEYRQQINGAREEIHRERESALREVRQEVAGMVVQASEQILGRSINEDDHERLISEALDELEAEVAGSTSGSDGAGRG